jgi:peroxiredoxin Q/BCP
VEKMMYGKAYMGTLRTTFLIDETGIITDIIEKVESKRHSEQIVS